MRARFLVALFALLFAACGSGQGSPASEAPASEAPASEAPVSETPASTQGTTEQARRCLPVVHGCGCAERCGDGFQQADGSWGIVRPMGDSALEAVTLERRCFDSTGVSYPEEGHPPAASNCIDVFYDQTPCGGECIPRTDFLSCALNDEGNCAP